MRRATAAVTAALAIFLFWVSAARAQEQNWSISLAFATDNAEDPLPLVIGVQNGAGGATELKPPPLPGIKDVGDARYAVVSSWVVDPGARRVVMRKLGADAVQSTALAWPVTVLAEETGADVFVTPDLAGVPPGMKVFLVDPAGRNKVLLKSGERQKVYESAGGEKELVAVASREGSFLAADSAGRVFGYMETAAGTPAAGAEIFVDGGAAPSATAAADGTYSLSLSPGKHDIVMDTRVALKSRTAITVGGAPAAAEPPALRVGDINGDGVIDIADFVLLKKGYGKTAAEAGGDSVADINGDGVIDIADFVNIKKHFGIAEDEE